LDESDDIGLARDDNCRFPDHSPGTGYGRGCRCRRCFEHQRSSRVRWRDPKCARRDCTRRRLKGNAYCEEHRPPALVRSSTTVAERTEALGLRTWATCIACGGEFGWYQSVLDHNVRAEQHELCRVVCTRCRKHFMGTIRGYNLSMELALQLITATECNLCGERFTTTESGRRAKCVDHDHACCKAESSEFKSCGRCVRGIICHRCNRDIAGYEKLMAIVGPDRIKEYLSATSRQ
jgi:hypothetical protein